MKLKIYKLIYLDDLNSVLVDYDAKVFLRDLLDGLFPYKYVVGNNVFEKSDDLDRLVFWCNKYLSNKKFV